jgi:hypothetical protein
VVVDNGWPVLDLAVDALAEALEDLGFNTTVRQDEDLRKAAATAVARIEASASV